METIKDYLDSWELVLNKEVIPLRKNEDLGLTLEEFINLPQEGEIKGPGVDTPQLRDFFYVTEIANIIRRVQQEPENCSITTRSMWHKSWDQIFLPHPSGLTFEALIHEKVREELRKDLPEYERRLEEKACYLGWTTRILKSEGEEFSYIFLEHKVLGPQFPTLLIEELYGSVGGRVARVPTRLLSQIGELKYHDNFPSYYNYWLERFKKDKELLDRTWFLGRWAVGEKVPCLPEDDIAIHESIAVLSEDMGLRAAVEAARML